MGAPDLLTARVQAVRTLCPNMIRIVLGGGDLASYVPAGVPDEAVALWFRGAGPSAEPIGRNYSVRAFDTARAEMTIDFVVHDGGAAAQWAKRATPGDEVEISRPRSWYRPAPDTEWLLLVADLAGLPALARILEERDPAVPAHAIVEVIDEQELAMLPEAPGVTVDCSTGTGNGVAPSVLSDRVRAHPLPPGTGYAWFAGEAGEARQVRKFLRTDHGWSRDRLDAIGYWRVEAERWTARYERVQNELIAVYRGALEAGRSEKEASELYDDALERAGL
ncbi:NADPH-dependent ferric siderophore reductase [Pseudonocardia hierapolitana]|uniref:NADPH-dependent ferric siderophore reductase n=1 Tax=Pseudonocardia hierapolitana TaxID=1128676 RepID=A0A561SU12_9PSEU|nr:siderophore-interacting protein [Pseudonocardia hierapolitana]TWF78342.1 NADPH-dependent ferric siderophore reductase [Pseudonocardia hierapolitana]